MGWRYRVVTEPNEQFHANVTWLSQYRCEPIDHRVHREAILEDCSTGATLDELLDVSATPALMLAVVFHILWRRDLRVPLEQAIRHDSVLVAAPGATA